MTRVLPFALCLSLLAGVPAHSCGFHNYAPQPTIVERMMDGSSVVLARQSRTSSFKFEVSELLSGKVPDTPIPFLIDGSTRRKLEAGKVSVLFSYSEVTQSWSRLATIDNAIRPVLNDIVASLPAWRMGNEVARAQSFADLLDHPNPVVHTLALRELDLVGYDVLRALSIHFDAAKLLKDVDTPMEQDNEAIQVLLLGLSGDLTLATDLEQGVLSNRHGFGPALGAYATAWIELQGIDAVKVLSRDYLFDPAFTPSAQTLIVEALALHRNFGDPDLRDAISHEMAMVVQKDPSLAALAARYFAGRGQGLEPGQQATQNSFSARPSATNVGN
ncbi:hypothetical protein [uncultured Shimia sp.]|uniref:hypothetical protein n=1 Tax=uncultured Shimia sp. TaxID=573152 RepID=UPI00260E1FAF|nr:hypothetical protein [uncultured Shimia sp.]